MENIWKTAANNLLQLIKGDFNVNTPEEVLSWLNTQKPETLQSYCYEKMGYARETSVTILYHMTMDLQEKYAKEIPI